MCVRALTRARIVMFGLFSLAGSTLLTWGVSGGVAPPWGGVSGAGPTGPAPDLGSCVELY